MTTNARALPVHRRKPLTRLTALLVFSLALVGCATGYHARGFGGGYSDTQLGENIFQISFRGNGYTSAERAADLALLRSAEIAAEHGYPFFVVISEREDASRSTYTTPTTTTGSATVTGNTISGSSTMTGGDTYVTVKPSTRNTILGFKERPNGFAYEARFVIRSLRQKYGLAPTSQ
jgi:hypothetical protein